MSSELNPKEIMMELDREDGFDAKFHTDTWSATDAKNADSTFDHFPTLPRMFASIMGRIELPFDEYVFLDIGCGKGRGLMMASDYPFKRCLGFELESHLQEIAKANLAKYRSPSQRCFDLDAICADATTADLPREDLFLFIANPWDAERPALALIASLRRSLEATPRRVVLLYTRPMLHHLFDEAGYLHRWGPQGITPPPAASAPLETKAGRYAFALYSNL